MGYDEEEVSDLLNLVKLLKKVKSNDPIDNDSYATELKQIMQDLTRHAHKDYLEKSNVIEHNPDHRKKEIEEKINEIIQRMPKTKDDKMSKRERNLLVRDIADLIGEIIGQDYIEKIPNWDVDMAEKLKPNKLAHVPKEEKEWIRLLQKK